MTRNETASREAEGAHVFEARALTKKFGDTVALNSVTLAPSLWMGRFFLFRDN